MNNPFANVKEIIKVRKERSDKGKPRGKYKPRAAKAEEVKLSVQDIVKKRNIPVQTYDTKTSSFKPVRKQRSDKGKRRKITDPMEKLKYEVKKVNQRLIDTQKRLANQANNRIKTKITSRPAALQAVDYWANDDKSKHKYLFEKNEKGYTIFNEDEVNKLIASGDKEKIRTLKEMVEGNNKTDYEAHRTGMYNAKSLTAKGREEIHESAYQTFISEYKNEIGSLGMTRESYDELWTLFNEYKQKFEAEAAYDIFYGQYRDAVKNGLLKNDSLEWQKWFIAQMEQYKRDKEATL